MSDLNSTTAVSVGNPVSQTIAVLGTGGMGTACALLLAGKPDLQVRLWGRSPEHVAELAAERRNQRLLPEIPLPDSIVMTSVRHTAVQGADWIIVAVPTAYLRATLTPFAPLISAGQPVISVVKGIENQTLLRPSELIADVWPGCEVVALGGPSHAEEFARRLPASVVAAHPQIELARAAQALMSTETFRVYARTDRLGVELAGAVKNVLAIAAGLCDGMRLGDNAKAALLSRGLAEIVRLGDHFRADPETFAGLAGLGDLVTTCFSPFGRNRRVGERLGRGETLEQIMGNMQMVAEGVLTSLSLRDLAHKHHLDLPITEQVYRVLYEGLSPHDGMRALMARPPKDE